MDKNCNTVVEYTYDAWGKLLNMTDSSGDAHIGQKNPFLYRGYYYDSETWLYYLNSRYYDPQTGRFLNSDEQLGLNQDLLSYNLFAYCGNNPINRLDPSGLLWGEIKNFFNKAANAVVSTVQNIAHTVSSWASSAWTTTSSWLNSIFDSASVDAGSYSNIQNYHKKEISRVKIHGKRSKNQYRRKSVKLRDTKSLKVVKSVSKGCAAISTVLTVKSFIYDTQMTNHGLAMGIDAVGFVASAAAGAAIGSHRVCYNTYSGIWSYFDRGIILPNRYSSRLREK